jgi:kynurenine formamidase
VNFCETKPYDLGQPYYTGMPHYPTHPPFLYSLTKLHGEIVLPNGATSAADAIALGTHVGTHIDSLSHFSCNGVCFGGKVVEQSYGTGMSDLSVEQIEPIVRRGVLLDVAGVVGVDELPEDFEILPEHLDQAQRAEIRPGDVALIRTGWARFFGDPARYVNSTKGPGPGLAGAKWLSSKKVFAAGADTVAFEKSPSQMEVHVHLLVESGIHLIEVLNLEELARDQVCEFTLVAAPMKIRGATGAPVRPLAFPISAV